MKFSQHARIRMGQRGIPGRMIELARKHGRIEGDQWVLDRREARAALEALMAERAALLKVIDKGGVVVVEEDNTVVTTYNITERMRR
jgi:hypothetical protein